MNWQSILFFWFESTTPKQWFTASKDFDTLIRERYFDLWQQACKGELSHWRTEPLGRLAEVLVLDQFSRNLNRNSPLAFAQDGMALALAQEAIAGNHHRTFTHAQKSFLFMPFMHSESLLMQQTAIELFSLPGLEMNLDFAHQHLRIIERFGRFPHRNRTLGRTSTPEEIEFLKTPGSSF